MDDDIFEIEVIDLRAGSVPSPVSLPLRGAPDRASPHRATPPLAVSAVTRPLLGQSPLAARRRTRGKLLAGAGAVIALVVALAVVLASAPGTRSALGLLFATPTAATPGADTFQVANAAPWGTLAADGRTITLNGFGYQPAIFQLTGGSHQLVFNAPPFPVLRCRVSVPAAPSDNCPMVAADTVGGFSPTGKHDIEGLRVLDLQATVDNLPPGPKAMLLAATGALLGDARWLTTVQPGEHYRAADGTLRVAATPLMATLALGLNLDTNTAATINGISCAILCTLPEAASAIGGWPLLASVTANWRISTPDGILLVAATPSPPDAPPPFTPLPLIARWNSGWQVAFMGEDGGPFGLGAPSGNPTTNAASQALCNLAQMVAGVVKTPSGNYGTYGWIGLAAHPADGCVVDNQTTNVTQQLTGQPELLLFRFGVLLAASDLAHQLNPDLPLADAFERTVAAQAAHASLPPQFTTTG